MKITEMKVNNIERPVGFYISRLSFSWKVTEPGHAKRMKNARLEIKEEGKTVFDSGVDEQADSLDYRVGFTPKPRTRYTYRVTVTADTGGSAFGESFFEMGKMQEPWTAKWIASPFQRDVPPVMRRNFQVKKSVRSARAYMCGLGVYEFYLNGEKTGKEYLAPGYHSYDFHLQVQTYDITESLIEGENLLEVFLGDGWFKGKLGFDGGYTELYGDNYYLIQEIHVTYADGSREILGTDKTYRCRKSPILSNSIYDGEVYDARILQDENPEELAAKEEAPKNCGPLTDRLSLPVVQKEKIAPVSLSVTPKGESVLDFGQNLTGWVEFFCRLPRGEKIVLTGAEILQDGCFYHENMRQARTEYVYISDGNPTRVRPHFTFYGFRYMKVETEGEVRIEDFTAWHLRSDFDQTGWIETGKEKVNKLFSNVLWSQKDNFLDVPTDCPQRDERLGWTGDAQVFSDTACFNMYMPAFYRKYLWDMRAEQSILGGSVPNVVPRIKREMIGEHGSCPWADAAVIIPWNVYLHYGSKTLLEEMYPGMKSWVDCQREKEENLGGPHLIKDGFHFADWLALDNEQPGPFGATDPLFIASAYYCRCAGIIAEAAGVLKDCSLITKEEKEQYETDEKNYKILSEEIKAALIDKYYGIDGECLIKTQTALALTLAFEILPKQRKEDGIRLQKLVEENKNHLNTGFVGTPILCPALSMSGQHETAAELLLNESYPGWLYCVNLGATTIWERWNSVLPDGHMNPEGMNSLNHYSYGSIAAWMYRELCGIHNFDNSKNCRRIQLRPIPDRRLIHAKAVCDTAAGRVISGFYYEVSGKVRYEMEIPFHMEAEVVLPEGRYRVNDAKQVGSHFCLDAGNYIIEEL